MIQIKPITNDADAATIAALEAQFAALHASMRQHGSTDELVSNGAKEWVASVLPMAGRLTFLFGAWRGTQLVGFVAGVLRSLPPYLGSATVGMLTHIHVDVAERGHQLGEGLFLELAEIFKQRGAVRMEIDVLAGNSVAQDFFVRMGAKPHHLLLHRSL